MYLNRKVMPPYKQSKETPQEKDTRDSGKYIQEKDADQTKKN
jgi:hypothetical protein